MPPNTEPLFALKANVKAITFLPGGTTTPVDVFIPLPAGNGAKCFAINVVSDDTATVNMQVFVRDGTTNFLLGTKAIPTLVGTTGALASVNLLDPLYIAGLDQDGGIFLPAGYTLRVAPKVAITAAKVVTMVAFGYEY